MGVNIYIYIYIFIEFQLMTSISDDNEWQFIYIYIFIEFQLMTSTSDDNEWQFKNLSKWFEGFSKKLVLWMLITFFIIFFIEFQLSDILPIELSRTYVSVNNLIWRIRAWNQFNWIVIES